MGFCSVPGCKSGYKSQRKNFKKLGKKIPSLFSFNHQDDLEKWNRAIPRVDRSFSAKDYVCELHFNVNDIERNFTHKFPDGSIQVLERGIPRLKPGSIPTIFPNLPDRFSKKLQKRKTPVERVPVAKKIKACELNFVESDFEREASAYDPETNENLSNKLSNVQLKKDVPTPLKNSRNYLSRRRCRRQDSEERCVRLENTNLQSTVQKCLKSATENEDQSANAVATFLAPINIIEQMDLTTSNSVHWNKNELTALIALYQSEKCLYDKNHEHYYDLHEINKACERIKNVLLNLNFICTIQQIKNKIRSLHSKYASEKVYKDRCIQAGQFTEDTYGPTMWCFGLLQFLDDFIESRTEIEIKAEIMEEDQHEIQLLNSNVNHLDIKLEPEEVSNIEVNVPLKIDSSFSLNAGFNENFELNRKGMEKTNIKISASNKLNAIKIFSQDSEEKEDIFGEYIASEMTTLKDNPLLYMRTKQAIIDVLTNANFDLVNS